MGIFGERKRKGPSDMELYNYYLERMGTAMMLARSEHTFRNLRVYWALNAVERGISAYQIRVVAPAQRRPVVAWSDTALLRHFGEEFAMGYKKLKENEQKARGGENGELVKESIELMEKLAKRIREMLGLV